MKDNGYALVLSGGGAKGVYHVGVWQALREIGIKIDAVIGTSVGAIMAGFIAQGDYDIAESVITDMSIDKIITIPEQLIRDGRIVLNRMNLQYLRNLQEDIMKKGGFDTHPLRNLLEKHLNEKKIRSNHIDLGLVTYQVNELKPREIFIEDMESGLLIDYILASASLPGFSMTEIKKKKYIDGGVFNNIPFNMAKERGYKKIIVVDISGTGWNRRPDIAGTNTIYIKNSIKMGGILDFDKKFLRNYRELGYLDTLNIFKKIDGIDYFYIPDEKKYKKLLEILFTQDSVNEYAHLLEFSKWKEKTEQIGLKIKGILPDHMRHHKMIVYCLAECAAWSLNIEKLRLYTFNEFLCAVWEKYSEVENNIRELQKRLSAKTIKEWIHNIIYLSKNTDVNELMETSIYEYDRILEMILRMEKKRLPFSSLSFFYPKLTAAKLFFIILKKYLE